MCAETEYQLLKCNLPHLIHLVKTPEKLIYSLFEEISFQSSVHSICIEIANRYQLDIEKIKSSLLSVRLLFLLMK